MNTDTRANRRPHCKVRTALKQKHQTNVCTVRCCGLLRIRCCAQLTCSSDVCVRSRFVRHVLQDMPNNHCVERHCLTQLPHQPQNTCSGNMGRQHVQLRPHGCTRDPRSLAHVEPRMPVASRCSPRLAWAVSATGSWQLAAQLALKPRPRAATSQRPQTPSRRSPGCSSGSRSRQPMPLQPCQQWR